MLRPGLRLFPVQPASQGFALDFLIRGGAVVVHRGGLVPGDGRFLGVYRPLPLRRAVLQVRDTLILEA